MITKSFKTRQFYAGFLYFPLTTVLVLLLTCVIYKFGYQLTSHYDPK